MKTSELTTDEVEEMIDEHCKNDTIGEDDFNRIGLDFEKILSDDLSLDEFHKSTVLYFFCKNGVLTIYLDHHSFDGKHFTSKRRFSVHKVTSEDLEVIAEQYFEAKHNMQVLEKVLESDKLRGLFAKMKASK